MAGGFSATDDWLDGHLVGIDGIDEIGLDLGDFDVGKGAFEDGDFCGMNDGSLFAGEDLDALGGGISPLIELSWEILSGKCMLVWREF